MADCPPSGSGSLHMISPHSFRMVSPWGLAKITLCFVSKDITASDMLRSTLDKLAFSWFSALMVSSSCSPIRLKVRASSPSSSWEPTYTRVEYCP
ncbi:hypothetical protein D3C75_647810 [compost metagenome]